MTFLAPLFLLGALAVAGPFIFHLIRRTTRERTKFGSLMFLESSPPRLTKKSRLEHLLLLLLRCVAIGLLAFAFARPFWQETVAEASAPGLPTRMVVAVDASASMRRGDLWTQAKARALAAVEGLAPGDQAAVLLFGRSARSLVSFEEWSAADVPARRALLQTRLEAASPTWESTQLGGALTSAAELLLDNEAAVHGPRRIVLISDVQSGSRTEALASYEWPQGVQVTVDALKARPASNASIQLVAEAADSERGGELAVRVRVVNAADATKEQFTVSWAGADGKAMGDALQIYVPPGQSRVVAVPVTDAVRGATAVVLAGDDEPFDNRVHATPPEKRQVRVVYLGSENPADTRQPLFFMQRALTDTSRLDLDVVALTPGGGVTAGEPASFYVVTDPLPEAAAAALRTRVETGGTVLVAPKGRASAATLGALIGRPDLAMEDARPGNYAMLTDIDFRHPVFVPFADPRFSDFTKIHVWAYRKISRDGLPEHRVVASFDTGDPALVEFPVGQGRVLFLATGWIPGDSQLGVSSKFVPLLYSFLELGGALPAPFVPYLVGDPLPRPPGPALPVRVDRPGATATEIPPEARAFTATDSPGTYRLSVGSMTATYAVNLDPAETRLDPLSLDELEQLGLPLTPDAATSEQTAARQVVLRGAETEGRQKLWRWFIGAALLILVLESALAGLAARRTPTPGAAVS